MKFNPKLVSTISLFFRKPSGAGSGRTAVIVVSSGDADRKWRRQAAAIARQMSETCRWSRVVFGDDVRMTSDHVRGAEAVVFVCSPHGRRSYEDFVARRQLATWKDSFVVAAFRCFHDDDDDCVTSSGRKRQLTAVHFSAAEHVPSDFTESNRVAVLDATCRKQLRHFRRRLKLGKQPEVGDVTNEEGDAML